MKCEGSGEYVLNVLSIEDVLCPVCGEDVPLYWPPTYSPIGEMRVPDHAEHGRLIRDLSQLGKNRRRIGEEFKP